MLNDFYKMDTNQRAEKSFLLQYNFLEFVKFWFETIQNESFIVNWHHELICQEIQDVIHGESDNPNLVINIPAGGTKTEIVSIHAPAYMAALAVDNVIPKFRNLCISFSDSLVKRNSRRCRDLLASREFQELYKHDFSINQAEEWEIIKNERTIGQTNSRSLQGQITGSRAGFVSENGEFTGAIILDDLQKVEDAFSQTKREVSNRVLVSTIRSRRADKSKENSTPVWCIQQRLHVDDCSNFLLSGKFGVPFKNILVPALITEEYLETNLNKFWRGRCWEYIKKTDSKIINGTKYWSYFERVEHISGLLRLWERCEATFMAQYMQRPIKDHGLLIDSDWFNRYEQLPKLKTRAVYVDTNSGKAGDHLDWSVFMLVGVCFKNNLYIIDVTRTKGDPAELLSISKKLWLKYNSVIDNRDPFPVRYFSIEDAQAGQGLIVQLKKVTSPAIPVKSVTRGANQNKLIRHHNCQPMIKEGRVFIPKLHRNDGTRVDQVFYENKQPAASTEWVLTFLSEIDSISADVLLNKTVNYHDDQFDCLLDAVDDNLITGVGAQNFANWI